MSLPIAQAWGTHVPAGVDIQHVGEDRERYKASAAAAAADQRGPPQVGGGPAWYLIAR